METPANDHRIVEALNGGQPSGENENIQIISETLDGGPTAAEKKRSNEMTKAFNGEPDAAETYQSRMLLEAITGERAPREVLEGELPLQTRELEETRIYAAESAVDRAADELAKAVRARRRSAESLPGEVSAGLVREEAYALAAQHSPYESDRLRAVAAALTAEAHKPGTAAITVKEALNLTLEGRS